MSIGENFNDNHRKESIRFARELYKKLHDQLNALKKDMGIQQDEYIDPIEQTIKFTNPIEDEKPMAQLTTMAKEFNKENPGKRVTVEKLEEVFTKGIEVFNKQGLEGNENAFAMSFVKKFLNAYAKKK